MKKTYIIPNVQVVNVNLTGCILVPASGDQYEKKDTGGNGVQLGRENNAWDIWDDGGDDFEE